MRKLHSDEFWQYSLDRYKDDEIQRLCLMLQDEWQLNVNVLLLCCYLNHKKWLLKSEQFSTLMTQIQRSEDALVTHRNKRRLAKNQAPEHYKELLEEELNLEKVQQNQIVETANILEPKPESGNNLFEYAKSSQKPLTKGLSDQLKKLYLCVTKDT